MHKDHPQNSQKVISLCCLSIQEQVNNRNHSLDKNNIDTNKTTRLSMPVTRESTYLKANHIFLKKKINIINMPKIGIEPTTFRFSA